MHRVVYQFAVSAFLLVTDQMAFIDQYQINMADLVRFIPHRLNAGERNRLANIPAPHTRRIDA